MLLWINNKNVGNVKMRETARKPQGKEQSEKFLLEKADVGVGRGEGGRAEITVIFSSPFSSKRKKKKCM